MKRNRGGSRARVAHGNGPLSAMGAGLLLPLFSAFGSGDVQEALSPRDWARSAGTDSAESSVFTLQRWLRRFGGPDATATGGRAALPANGENFCVLPLEVFTTGGDGVSETAAKVRYRGHLADD